MRWGVIMRFVPIMAMCFAMGLTGAAMATADGPDITAADADADADLGVRYSLALAGVPIGEARIGAVIGESAYRLSYDIAFELVFWSGSGRGEAVGRVTPEGLRPDTYRVSFSGRTQRAIAVDYTADGNVAAFSVDPPFNSRRFGPRVAILPDQLRGVVDPLTALVLPDAEGTRPGDALCGLGRSVFSGAARFDLAADTVEGPVDGMVTCTVFYEPISGHRFQSDGVERLRATPLSVVFRHHPEIGAWLPERAAFPTRLGDLVFARADTPES